MMIMMIMMMIMMMMFTSIGFNEEYNERMDISIYLYINIMLLKQVSHPPYIIRFLFDSQISSDTTQITTNLIRET
jgi:hypothetical protein